MPVQAMDGVVIVSQPTVKRDVGGRPRVETGSSRLAGYEEAMHDAGLEPKVVSGEFRVATAQQAMDDLLNRGDDPTALVVANNLMTIGVLRSLRRNGLRIPDDMALGAVDNPVWAELLDPPLTTLAQPVRMMAQTAMEMVLDRLEDSSRQPQHVVFPMELQVRASSGSAPGVESRS